MSGDMKDKFPFIGSIVFSIITAIAVLILGLYQLMSLVILRIEMPRLSNVSRFELLLIGIILFSTFVARIFLKTASVKSRDSKVPSEAYLQKKRIAKIAIVATCVAIFFTV